MNPARGKDVPLEALRGVASVSVMCWHIVAAFYPRHFPYFSGRHWIVFFSGGSAVNFFFVLSGFVLTRRALAGGNSSDLARAAVKRWPRLAAPITIAVIVSWTLARLGLYAHVPAAAITHSTWLAKFANAGSAPGGTIIEAVRVGLYDALFRGTFSYNSSLWTMVVEFRGSFLALGLALLLVALADTPVRVRIAIGVTAVLVVEPFAPLYLTFVAGVLLAARLAARPWPVPTPLACALVAAALILEGYGSDNEYAPAWDALGLLSPTNIHIGAALMLLGAVEGCEPLRHRLSGGWARFLGTMSFPLYLLHVLAICSLGSAILVTLAPSLGEAWARAGAAVASAAGAFAMAYPVMRFDRWWLGRVNRAAYRLVPMQKKGSVLF